HRRGDDQHLPLWHLQPRAGSDQGGGGGQGSEARRPGHPVRQHREQGMSAPENHAMDAPGATAMGNLATATRPPPTARSSRRRFLKGSVVAAGGLVVPFSIPFDARARGAGNPAAPAAPEINAWVVVKPDDTIVVRIARS